MKNQIGVIGMAVMGSNLALNLADHGFNVAIYNRTTAVAEKVAQDNPEKSLDLLVTLDDFVQSLEKPRKIILMVKAGRPVDALIAELLPRLDQGDILMDGGNSYFKDTIRRTKEVRDAGFRYLGVGISGGEEGARFGPSIMPGGDQEAYSYVAPYLEAISAKAYGEDCCSYIGDNGAGHYVKMVHNGIEYGDMQLIAESYWLLKDYGLSNSEIGDIFASWNKGKLDSFLIEITAAIFKEKDPETGRDMIDIILDKAGQKGTGKWTAEESLELGVTTTVITSAVYARFMSALKEQRVNASKVLAFKGEGVQVDKDTFVKAVEDALYLGKIVSYAQGFTLLDEAAKANEWTLDYGQISKLWRGGCIIRAAFLNDIASAFSGQAIANLLLAPKFTEIALEMQPALRLVVSYGATHGVSIPGLMSALSYFDGYRNQDSSANLIQAQRDLFGAHTFERVDREGSFHHEWSSNNE